MRKNIVVLGAVVVCTLLTVSPVTAGMIDDFPLVSLENNTPELEVQNPFYDTYMNATFMIFQPELWSEVFPNIIVPPGGMIDEYPILLNHKIDDDHELFFSIKVNMTVRSPSGQLVGYAYAFEDGVDPPAEEPNFPPVIEIPLADPRPTPIVLFGYASPPTPVGAGSVELDSIPDAPEIAGPTTGKVGTSYAYKFKAIDADADNVSFCIEWGDGSVTNWTAFHASGSTYSEYHTWNTKGTYTIKAKARDEHGAESDWAIYSVQMPFSFNIPFQLFWEMLFERFPHAFPILRHMMGY